MNPIQQATRDHEYDEHDSNSWTLQEPAIEQLLGHELRAILRQRKRLTQNTADITASEH